VLNRLYNAARLALVLGAAWLLLVGPAAFWQGSQGVEGLSWAALVCLVPGLFVVMQVAGMGVERPLAGLVVGMALRLAVVSASAVLLCSLNPDLRGETFLVWLVPCYLAALAVETRLLLDDRTGRKTVPAAACRT
jgi:hypothetical protein